MKEYYYFSTRDKELANGDGRKIQLGVTHKVECTPILCKQGLHASVKALDALQYAHSPILWKVTLGGKVIHGEDKSVATERTYVRGGIDISYTLQAFARKCALDVAHMWDAPQVVIDYLKTGDESLRDSARVLAWDSISASARNQAWNSAWYSAWYSTWDSTRESARTSARTSARAMYLSSARDSAWYRDSQNRRLAQMISRAIREN